MPVFRNITNMERPSLSWSLASKFLDRRSDDTGVPVRFSQSDVSNVVELAAIVVPQAKTDLFQRLRVACEYLPVPLTLGWTMNTNEIRTESLVPGLQLTDIGSGATREVSALWMHTVYQRTKELQPRGVTLLQLKEAGFSSMFQWQHYAICAVIAIQTCIALYAFRLKLTREGLLILGGVALQLLNGVYDWYFPAIVPPRRVKRSRFYALHTRMTTTHILLLSHGPQAHDPTFPYINLEDAAAPMQRVARGRRIIAERFCVGFLGAVNWVQKAVCVMSNSGGWIIPLVLLIGTIAVEAISLLTDGICKKDFAPIPLETDPSLLDMLTASCQTTGMISVGFIEAILPDRKGEHTDYKWISAVMERGPLNAGPHPTHASTNTVLSSVLRRRTVQVR